MQLKKKKKKKKQDNVVMNVSDTTYGVVRYVGKKILRWKVQHDPQATNWDVWWTDGGVQAETLGKMQRKVLISMTISFLKDQPLPWDVCVGSEKSPGQKSDEDG